MGKFIAIDGLDGSGKGTVAGMLKEYLEEHGVNVYRISFPMYDNKSSALVKMYLDGEMGQHPDDTNAYAASSLFALDRYVSFVTDWKSFYSEPDSVLIADRYTSANAVHQLSKLPRDEWNSFLSWLFDFEYQKLGIPAPDITIFLEMKPDIAMRMIAKRAGETGRASDIHEKDPEFLARSYEAALFASEKLGWIRIPSYTGNEPRALREVFNDLLSACGLNFDI